MSLSQVHSSRHVLASDLSSTPTTQIVSSIVDTGVNHMATNGGVSTPAGLLSSLNNPPEPINNIINLLSPENNPDSFPGVAPSSNIHHSLVASPHTELTTTQTLVEHGNRSGISLIQPQSSRGGGNLPFTSNENHPNNNNHPSPTTERIDRSKSVESIQTGGNDHSPKYISL